MLELKNISLRFADRQIFSDFNLSIAKGEKVILRGRSGSGKSTLLNLIMGFVIPDEGDIFINYQRVSQANILSVRKQMCWLPQNIAFQENAKVRNVITQPFDFSANRKLIPTETHLIEAVSVLSLSPSILEEQMQNLSGGEKQRIGLIISKFLDREIILLDEPSSALDKDSLHSAAKFILGDSNKTIISASHDDEWVKYFDRVVNLAN